ncbi:MAG: NYN domain-containing protein [Solirubrobacterales bacterium]
MKTIFVDGYNVINYWTELKEIKDYSLEASRNKLIEILNNYATFYGYRVYIIFDAHLVKGSLEKKEKVSDKLYVVFTKEGETADAFIEKSVDEIGRKADVSVVTSDSLEQQVIFQRGAVRVSSLEFYHEVKDAEGKIKGNIEKKYTHKKHTLEEIVNKDILEKLEKIRRSD